MSKDRGSDADERILTDFRSGMSRWAGAVEAHKQAPPDVGFAARLAAASACWNGPPRP